MQSWRKKYAKTIDTNPIKCKPDILVRDSMFVGYGTGAEK